MKNQTAIGGFFMGYFYKTYTMKRLSFSILLTFYFSFHSLSPLFSWFSSFSVSVSLLLFVPILPLTLSFSLSFSLSTHFPRDCLSILSLFLILSPLCPHTFFLLSLCLSLSPSLCPHFPSLFLSSLSFFLTPLCTWYSSLSLSVLYFPPDFLPARLLPLYPHFPPLFLLSLSLSLSSKNQNLSEVQLSINSNFFVNEFHGFFKIYLISLHFPLYGLGKKPQQSPTKDNKISI